MFNTGQLAFTLEAYVELNVSNHFNSHLGLARHGLHAAHYAGRAVSELDLGCAMDDVWILTLAVKTGKVFACDHGSKYHVCDLFWHIKSAHVEIISKQKY